MADLFDVIHAQRACRDFAPTEVPDHDVARMLEAATHAPSAENRQPWVFVVVRDEDRRAAIVALLQGAWAAGAEEHSRGRLPERLFSDVDRGIRSGIGVAPVHVVVAADTSLVTGPSIASSIFPAVQNLLLAATALGYGSALTTLAAAPAELAALLSLPEQLRPVAVVPIGRPARPLGPPRRAPIREKAHQEQYGNPF